MSEFTALPAAHRDRMESAATWHLRLRKDPSLEHSSDYLQWMADIENSRAFKAVDEGWSTIGDLGVAPQILDWRQAALRRARRAGARHWRSSGMMPRLAAALAVVIMLGGGALYYLLRQPTAYVTDVGERRTIALPDGSRISLDSATEVRVRYTKTARALTLERGRARFDVASDLARPFTVTAGTETIVAVGTSFNVEKLGSKVLVTLLQGHVVIRSAGPVPFRQADMPAVSLNTGEELIASADLKPAIVPANVQAATAWEAGHLVFRDETLAEAVARINRYTEHPITVDPSVASLRISGVFNAGDVASFVSAVTSYFPLQATTTPDNRVLLQRRT